MCKLEQLPTVGNWRMCVSLQMKVGFWVVDNGHVIIGFPSKMGGWIYILGEVVLKTISIGGQIPNVVINSASNGRLI